VSRQGQNSHLAFLLLVSGARPRRSRPPGWGVARWSRSSWWVNVGSLGASACPALVARSPSPEVCIQLFEVAEVAACGPWPKKPRSTFTELRPRNHLKRFLSRKGGIANESALPFAHSACWPSVPRPFPSLGGRPSVFRASIGHLGNMRRAETPQTGTGNAPDSLAMEACWARRSRGFLRDHTGIPTRVLDRDRADTAQPGHDRSKEVAHVTALLAQSCGHLGKRLNIAIQRQRNARKQPAFSQTRSSGSGRCCMR